MLRSRASKARIWWVLRSNRQEEPRTARREAALLLPEADKPTPLAERAVPSGIGLPHEQVSLLDTTSDKRRRYRCPQPARSAKSARTQPSSTTTATAYSLEWVIDSRARLAPDF